MNKNIKKVICLGLTLIACVGGLCACHSGFGYHAKMIRVDSFMRKDFLEQNRTYNVYYEGVYFNEYTGEWVEGRVKETEGPMTRDFIVKDEEEFLKIFNDLSSIDINFETQMLIVHMFTKSDTSPLVLTKLKVANGELHVTFKTKPPKIGDKNATEPGQACIAIIMDKVDITSAHFVWKD